MGTSPAVRERLQEELRQFQDLWRGGYYEGDPRDPLGRSSYGQLGYMSVLHATYLCCIKPYVGSQTKVLEIGPGRGAWTKTFVELGAREIWCLDAVSKEANRFDEYVDAPERTRYFTVSDFSCGMLPEDHFDYFFSFGTFCHIPPVGTEEYLRSLFPKLRSGAHGFLLIADYDKHNRALGSRELWLRRLIISDPRRALGSTWNWLADRALARKYRPAYAGDYQPRRKDEPDTPQPGRWYHLGTTAGCRLLERHGYEVVSPDVGTLHRDPIIHFRKP